MAIAFTGYGKNGIRRFLLLSVEQINAIVVWDIERYVRAKANNWRVKRAF